MERVINANQNQATYPQISQNMYVMNQQLEVDTRYQEDPNSWPEKYFFLN